MNDEQTVNEYEDLPNDEEAKQSHVQRTVRNFIDKHVVKQMPQQESAAMIDNMTCRYCGKKYVGRSYLNKHEEKEHGHIEDTQESTNMITWVQDHIYNYTRQVLVVLLLRINHNNAISLGDGGRVVRT